MRKSIPSTTLTVDSEQLTSYADNNELRSGIIYNLPDKNWYLVAYQTNTLKPISGYLHLFNGESIPEYIIANKLIIDSGPIDYDIETDAYPMIIPGDYIIKQVYVRLVMIEPSSVSNIIVDGVTIAQSFTQGGYKTFTFSKLNKEYNSEDRVININAVGINPNNAIRISVECEYIPISEEVPPKSIVLDVYTHNASSLYLIVSDLQRPSALESWNSSLIKINGTTHAITEVDIESYWYSEEYETYVTRIELEVAGNVFEYGQTITFEYKSDFNAFYRVCNIWGSEFPLGIHQVRNTIAEVIAPAVTSAVIGTNGLAIVLTYNVPLTLYTEGFSMTINGMAVPWSKMNQPGYGTTISISYSSVFKAGQVVLLSYTGTTIKTAENLELQPFIGMVVTNNSQVLD